MIVLAIRFIILICLFSCAYNPNNLHKETFQLFKNAGFVQQIHKKADFNIFTLEKISDSTKPLRIYIEGDGFAYATKSRPSVDPTPRSNFLLNLILTDNSANLLYIARPCQYVDSKKCDDKYWTSKRFSNEIIQAISAVIDEYQDYKIELVGYSGGALIVMQLSQKNIINLRTIAGNLDLESFANFHKIALLKTPKLNYQRLAKLPQIHFIGKKDKIIPVNIFISYQKKLKMKSCVGLKIIDGATHDKNWQDSWKYMLQLEVKCS